MASIVYQAKTSNVQHAFVFSDRADLKKKLTKAIKAGEILLMDNNDIMDLYNRGYDSVQFNQRLHYERLDTPYVALAKPRAKRVKKAA